MSASEEIDDAIASLKSAIETGNKYAENVTMNVHGSGGRREEVVILSIGAYDDMIDDIETAKKTLADANVAELEEKIDELQKRVDELEAEAADAE